MVGYVVLYGMKGKSLPDHRKRCTAMVKVGITDPESQAGIEFCTDCCPYSYCVIFEGKNSTRRVRQEGKITVARKLTSHDVSVEDIALILDISLRTVYRYLRL
ncbi:hypothetical protein LCGC14_1851990 [marine sediment metagenome]|uniref:Uncharacterized protein n=1 Tax=marine sediment metagenome TaxID=412755 RepID=A0A0F9J9B3_9ZZZZ